MTRKQRSPVRKELCSLHLQPPAVPEMEVLLNARTAERNGVLECWIKKLKTEDVWKR